MTTLTVQKGAALAAVPARPAITREILAAQFERLAAWDLDTADVRCEIAAGHVGGTWRDFDALCEAAALVDDIETGCHQYGPFDDPDVVERVAREAHADALDTLVDAAMARLRGGDR